MKTAKEWHEEYPMAFDDYSGGIVEAIQADALKDAVRLVNLHGSDAAKRLRWLIADLEK